MYVMGEDVLCGLYCLVPCSHRSKNFYLCFFFFIICLMFISFSVPFERDCSLAVCTGIPDSEKFDCHPEDGVSPSNCQQRGCCYQTISRSNSNEKKNGLPPLGVPYCFYPSDYVGYSVSKDFSSDGRQISANLTRKTPSGFASDVPNLKLVLTFIDDHTARIKITDAASSRFEAPIPLNDSLKKLHRPLYDVKLDSSTGELSIFRKKPETVVFKTNLFRLVYSDQFLQLSSHLPSPYFYGIGEKYGRFLRDVNWTRITLMNSDRPPVPNYPLYGSQPFYLSLEKDGNANGVFLLNSNPMDVILQPTPAVTFRPIGGIFDFFIFLGPTPANVVQQYTQLVGRTFMPPYWSLGFHLCRFGYKTLNKTRETMQRNLDAGIPIAVQWNDIDYMEKFKDFTYDKDSFAGLPEFVNELHEKGIHYVIMTDPGISGSEEPGTYPPYDEGFKEDIFIKNSNGSVFRGRVWTDGDTVWPDFSHPMSSAYWSKQFSSLYKEVKYDGVWIDMNEPSNFYDGEKNGCPKSTYEDPVYLPGGNLPLRTKTVCMTAKHYKTIHYNEHNLLGLREATATNEALKVIRLKRPFIISRASFAGQGTQSGHWSGDVSSTYEDMRYSIASMLNFNLYGISMTGTDICGFNGNTTVELCARWQSLGAFYPFSRNHNERITIEQDPVALGETVVEATLKSLGIRYLLLPYLYSLFYRSHAFGDTVVRPLFFEYPLDAKTFAIDEQFLWGPGLMIIPALYPNVTEVSAYLPKGIWYNMANRLINSTGEMITGPIGITDIGVLRRGGYLFPCHYSSSLNFKFLIMGGLDENKEAKGELYWDDGDSMDPYEHGAFTHVTFSANKNSFNTTVEHQGYTENMQLGVTNLYGLDSVVTEVSVNGVECEKRSTTIKDGMNDFTNGRFVDLSLNDPFCIFHFHPPMGLEIRMNNVTLLSPVSIIWN